MSATPDSTLANPEQLIADLQRQLAECRTELTQRTAERDEALEQQTATAEVLQVINSSPGDLAPVFDAILEKARKLCGTAYGSLELYEGGKFRSVAAHGLSGALVDHLRQPFEPLPGAPPARLIDGERIVQIADMAQLAKQYPDDPRAQAAAEYGLRTLLFVPMRKGRACSASSRLVERTTARLPTKKSLFCKASRRKRSSPWRTPGCSANCANVPTRWRS